MTCYIKASAEADDATATTIVPTVTSAVEGKVSIDVPRTATAVTGVKWWRLEAVDPGHENDCLTLLYGRFSVIPV